MPRNIFGVTPRMIVVIGDKPVLAKSADITLTNKSEPDIAKVDIALENIDSSVFQKPGQYYAIQIYAGYIDEASDSTRLMKDLIEGGKYKSHPNIFKRFDGFVDQPEWSHGLDGEMLTLNCKDAAGLLSDGKFSEKLEGSQTSAKSIVAMINSNIKGIKVVFDAPDFNMGQKDSSGDKHTYSVAGKSYWEVIKDIAENGGLNITKSATTITIGKQEQWKRHWQQIRTATKDKERDWTTYTNLKIRYGDKGRRAKEQVVVTIHGFSAGKSKRGKAAKSRSFEVRYPSSAKGYSGQENTEFIVIHWPTAIEQSRAKIIAEFKAKEYLRGAMTGSVDLPFANPEMLPDEGISFKADINHGLNHLDGKIFRIHSINEMFSEDGYSQSVEFETNAHFEKIDKPENLRVGPEPNKDAPGTRPVGYTLSVPLGLGNEKTGGFSLPNNPFGI